MSREKDLPLAPLPPRPRPLTSGSWPVVAAGVFGGGTVVVFEVAAGVVAVEVPGCGAGVVVDSSTVASPPAALEASSLASFWLLSLTNSSSSSNSRTFAALSSRRGRFVLI